MKQHECKRQKESMSALRTGEWNADLREHVSVCAGCSELLLIAGLLRSDAARVEPNIPNAAAVWWKGQLARRRAAASRATRFTEFSELFAVVAALGVFIAFVVCSNAPFLRSEFFFGRAESVLFVGLITASISILLALNIFYLSWKRE